MKHTLTLISLTLLVFFIIPASTFAQDKDDAVFDDLKELSTQDPDILFNTYIMAGEAYAKKHDLANAIASYEKAESLKPKDALALSRLGNFYYETGDYKGAVRVYTRLTELEPANTYHFQMLAEANYHLKGKDAALKVLDEMTAKNPNNAFTYANLAQFYTNYRMFGEAAKAAEKAVELEPGNLDLKQNLAAGLVRAGNLDQAEKVYTEIKSLAKEDWRKELIVRELAAISVKKGDTEELAKLESPAKTFAKGMDDLVGMAELYAANGQNDVAIDIYKEALKQDPDNVNCLMRITDLYMAQVKYSEAVKTLERLIGLRPDDETELERLAVAYANIKDEESSLGIWDKLINKNPDDASLLGRSAETLIAFKKSSEAIKRLDKAESLDAKNPYYARRRGDIYLEMAKLDEAKKEFESMLKKSRDDNEKKSARSRIGDIERRKKELAEKIEQAKRAAEDKEEGKEDIVAGPGEAQLEPMDIPLMLEPGMEPEAPVAAKLALPEVIEKEIQEPAKPEAVKKKRSWFGR